METKSFNTWADLKTFVDELRAGSEFIWRGHADNRWILSSSLYRYFESQDIPAKNRRDFELASVAQFQTPHLERPAGSAQHIGNEMDSMVLMQHHGCPTRLMDWSWSPYIATYFMLPDMTEVGALYGLNITKYQAFLARQLPLDDYDGGVLPPLPDRVFQRFLDTEHLKLPIPIAPSLKGGRVAEQQCIFLLDLGLSATTEHALSGISESVLWKLELPRSARAHAHTDLLSMNIDGAHLFDGPEGAAIRAKEWLFGAKFHGNSIETLE